MGNGYCATRCVESGRKCVNLGMSLSKILTTTFEEARESFWMKQHDTDKFMDQVKVIAFENDFKEHWYHAISVVDDGARRFYLHCLKSGSNIQKAKDATVKAFFIVKDSKITYDELIELMIPITQLQNFILNK